MNVLVALPHRDRELAGEIGALLRRAVQARGLGVPKVLVVCDKAWAMEELSNDAFGHCVIHDELPLDPTSSPAANGGLALAEHMRANGSTIPISLLEARSSWDVSDVHRLANLNLKLVRNSDVGLRTLIERILADRASNNVERIDIVVDLSKGPEGYRYRISGRDVAIPLNAREGALRIAKHVLDTAQELSHGLEGDRWTEILPTLGSHLHGNLVEQQAEFNAALGILLAHEKHSERARLHFRLHPQQYDVAFEAIKYPHDEIPWMLRAPVFRSLSVGTPPAAEPFTSENGIRELRCLIVLSDAYGACSFDESAPFASVSYANLKLARQECDSVLSVLSNARKTGRVIGETKVIGRDSPLTLSELKSVLASRRWDIVHYIGHTDYINDRGYFILPAKEPAEAEPFGVEELAPHLLGSRFVYLSSCEGTKLSFVRRLAEHGVATVIGFRVKVRDHLAMEHAQYFYDKFFEFNSLEQAFLDARRYFHRQYPKERLWACSSLVMQSA